MVATATSTTTTPVGPDRVVSGRQAPANEFKVEKRELTVAEKEKVAELARKDLATAVALDLGAGLGGTVREAAKPTSQLANNVDTQIRRQQEREADFAAALERNMSGGVGIHPAVIQAMMNQTSIPAAALNVRNLSGRIYA